jgi:hypothetical protein
MPCRNVIPKPVQKPHPPMWMACTNERALARKQWMRPLGDTEIPIVGASRAKAEVNQPPLDR